MRDLLSKIDNVLTEKARGLLYREPGDVFFQGTRDNPAGEMRFAGVHYFPSKPGAYADYDEMVAAQQELDDQYDSVTWVNRPTKANRAFAILTFDGPGAGQTSRFGKYFNEIRTDMAGSWKNNELPGGWQLDKASSLKGSYYRLKPSDLFAPDSEFDSPAAVVEAMQQRAAQNPAIPRIMPGMDQLLTGKLPVFKDTGDMVSAIRDDLGETIGPIALVQGMITSSGAEAARRDLLGTKGSYAGSTIKFPASKINGLVDSYITTTDGTEIGISSKGEKGATASVKNIKDGIDQARRSGQTDLLDRYQDQVALIDKVGQLSSIEFPLVIGAEQGLITAEQADLVRRMIRSRTRRLADMPMSSTDQQALQSLMSDYRPRDNPLYSVGYHVLASLARKVVTNINKDPEFGEACLKFLNVSPIIQLHLRTSVSKDAVSVTGFDSKYPPNFKGTVGLDASKVYAATGTNGRVTFSYNGGGDTDTDVDLGPAHTDTEALDQFTGQRLTGPGAKAARTRQEPRMTADVLGRERR